MEEFIGIMFGILVMFLIFILWTEVWESYTYRHFCEKTYWEFTYEKIGDNKICISWKDVNIINF